jgi:hypothetical protein
MPSMELLGQGRLHEKEEAAEGKEMVTAPR